MLHHLRRSAVTLAFLTMAATVLAAGVSVIPGSALTRQALRIPAAATGPAGHRGAF